MKRLVGLCAAVGLAACAGQAPHLPPAPVAAVAALRVAAQPVAEGPDGYANSTASFRFAGGLELTSSDTSRLHGVSDIEVLPDGRFVAVTDDGDLLKGRLALDPAGRLAGVADVSLAPLKGLEGRPISGGKAEADAEGLALKANGDLLVSFERHHRIWLYPADGGPPRVLPSPDAPFPENGGMEALALDPAAGGDAYLAGREDTRETWRCRPDGGCSVGFIVAGEKDASLVAARPLPNGRWAFLLRAFSPLTGPRIWLQVAERDGKVVDTLEIKRPATVDNFEGVSAQPRPDGSVRFYIVSDDNFSNLQRTLLLAYEWRPPGK